MRRTTNDHDDHKKGLQIKTNINQVITIVVMFLAMFVLPIQLYTLFEKNREAGQEAPYTQGNVQGASAQRGETKGIADTIETTFEQTNSNIWIYVGIAGAVIAIIILFLIIFLK